MLLQNLAVSRIPFYFRTMLDEITASNRQEVVVHAILMALVFTGITMVSMFLMRILIIGVSRRIEYRLRGQVFDKLLALDSMFYKNRETGDLVSRSTNDLNDVRTLLGPGFMYVPNSLSRFALFLPIMAGLSPVLMGLVTGLIVLVVTLILLFMPKMRRLFRSVQESIADINNRVWQTIAGIETIKLDTLEQVQVERFSEQNRAYIGHQMALARYRGFIWPFFVFMFSLGELVILVVGGRQVIQETMTIGQLLEFNLLVGYLTFPILSLGWIMSLIQQGISAMGRINEVLDHPVDDRSDTVDLPETPLALQVQNLTFRYPGTDAPVLNDISLTIRPGEAVGITGTIGCGKSTLVDLITGVMLPEPGAVFLGGLDLTAVRPESLGRRISVVPQDPFLFSRTLLDNIALGSGNTDADAVLQSARLAGLGRDINSFPDGLGEMIGERGITLSGGQKQRTALARAIHRSPDILVMDDALSAVDSRTEAAILMAVRSLREHHTMLIISHRISSLKELDRIYVMDEGRIVESGSHETLLETGGLYSRLAFLQQMSGDENGSQPEGTHV